MTHFKADFMFLECTKEVEWLFCPIFEFNIETYGKTLVLYGDKYVSHRKVYD
jgi:hypothetical protein